MTTTQTAAEVIFGSNNCHPHKPATQQTWLDRVRELAKENADHQAILEAKSKERALNDQKATFANQIMDITEFARPAAGTVQLRGTGRSWYPYLASIFIPADGANENAFYDAPGIEFTQGFVLGPRNEDKEVAVFVVDRMQDTEFWYGPIRSFTAFAASIEGEMPLFKTWHSSERENFEALPGKSEEDITAEEFSAKPVETDRIALAYKETGHYQISEAERFAANLEAPELAHVHALLFIGRHVERIADVLEKCEANGFLGIKQAEGGY